MPQIATVLHNVALTVKTSVVTYRLAKHPADHTVDYVPFIKIQITRTQLT